MDVSNPNISTALIAVAGSIIVAMLTFIFSKWRDRNLEVRAMKLKTYKEFFNQLHLFGVLGKQLEKEKSILFASALNKIYLIGSKKVMNALSECVISLTNGGIFDNAELTKKLNTLIFRMRVDIKCRDFLKFQNYTFRPLFMGKPGEDRKEIRPPRK